MDQLKDPNLRNESDDSQPPPENLPDVKLSELKKGVFSAQLCNCTFMFNRCEVDILIWWSGDKTFYEGKVIESPTEEGSVSAQDICEVVLKSIRTVSSSLQ